MVKRFAPGGCNVRQGKRQGGGNVKFLMLALPPRSVLVKQKRHPKKAVAHNKIKRRRNRVQLARLSVYKAKKHPKGYNGVGATAPQSCKREGGIDVVK